jgi:hypothetical protein
MIVIPQGLFTPPQKKWNKGIYLIEVVSKQGLEDLKVKKK